MAGALREILAKFGIEIDTKKLDEGKAKTDGLAKSLKAAATVFLGEKLLSGIRSFTSELIDTASQLQDTSAQLGISTQDLQRWQFVAKQSGAEAGDLAAGFKFLQKNAVDAAAGGKTTSDAFKKLGVDVEATGGGIKDTSALMREVGLALAKVPDPAQRTALALDILGKGGTKLAPIFAEGGEALDGLLKRFDELGGGLGDDAIKLLDDAGDKTDEFNLAMLSLKSRLAVDLFPYINKAIDWFTKFTASLGESAKGTNIFKAAIIVLGTAAAIAGVTAMAPWIPFGVLLALLVLIVDDLITGLEGGDSVTGRLLDKIFGKGAGDSIFKQIRADWDDLMAGIGDKTGWAALEEVFSQVGGSIVRFLVEDIPAAIDQAFGPGTWRAVAVVVTGGMSEIGTAIKETWAKLTMGLGEDVVNGIANGIKSAGSAAIDAMGSLADMIRKEFTGKFKINSPSQVGEDDAYQIPMGVVRGLAKGTNMIEAQADKTFEAAAFPRGGGFAGGNRSIQSDTKNEVHVHLHGVSGSGGVADAARDGTLQALNDNGRATLAALEDFAPED